MSPSLGEMYLSFIKIWLKNIPAQNPIFCKK